MALANNLFGRNVKFLRNRLRLTQEALASHLSVTRSKLNCIEIGQTKSPGIADLLKFSDYFKMSIDTLVRIDLSKLGELNLRELEAGNDVYIKGGNLRVLAITVDGGNNENIEYVPIKMKMGYASGGHADIEFIETLPKYSLPNLPKGRTYRTFPGEGASMQLPDGTDITGEFIQDWTTLKPGTAAMIVLKNGEFVFKQVTLAKEEGKFLLKSINPFFKPYTIPVEDVLEIWKFHCYTSKELPEAQTDMQELVRMVRELQDEVRKNK